LLNLEHILFLDLKDILRLKPRLQKSVENSGVE